MRGCGVFIWGDGRVSEILACDVTAGNENGSPHRLAIFDGAPFGLRTAIYFPLKATPVPNAGLYRVGKVKVSKAPSRITGR